MYLHNNYKTTKQLKNMSNSSQSGSSDRNCGRNGDAFDNENASSIQVDSDQESDDSVGSLVDFIVSDEGESGDELGPHDVNTSDEEITTASTTLAADLIASVPFDTAGAGTVTDSTGRRRSTRTRRAPERYVDENYARMMYDDVSMDELDDEDEDDEGSHCQGDAQYSGCEDYDEDYVVGMDVDESTDDSEYDDHCEGDDEAADDEAEAIADEAEAIADEAEAVAEAAERVVKDIDNKSGET